MKIFFLWLIGFLVLAGLGCMVAWLVVWWRATSTKMRGASLWQRL